MMFKKTYNLRRYGPEQEKGFPYTDISLRLNVQPVSAVELQALPEGERSVKRLKAFGRENIRTASQTDGTPADRLWYQGQWYECEGADIWDHTPLAHCESQWVAIPENVPQEAPPAPEGEDIP